MWFEFVRVTASLAVALSWLIGAALSFVMLMAVTEPMHASARAILARVWAWARRALSVALRAFAWVVKLPYGIAVTYLHAYRSDAARHFRGFGYRNQSAGRHRKQTGVFA